MRSTRVDESHGNLQWQGEGWPTDAQWEHLRAPSTLPIEYLAEVVVGDDGVATIGFELPMPGIRSPRLARTV